MRRFDEDESYYNNNKLNIAFIAENSKEIPDMQVRSISGSNQQVESISSISRRVSHANSIPGSPFLSFEPEISNMDEWSNQTPNIFGKKQPIFPEFRKRNTKNSIPQPILQMMQDDKQGEKMSKCSKKRMVQGQKSTKIITIPASQSTQTNQYQLRSKVKHPLLTNLTNIDQMGPSSLNINPCTDPDNENDSSSDQLRQMVAQIRDNQHSCGNGGNGGHGGNHRDGNGKKNFPLTRNARKMLGERMGE